MRVLLWLFLWVACGKALAADFIYTVQPGDHPWNVAERYLKHAALSEPLRQLNGISNDRRLRPGTRLRIPQAWLKLETAQVRLLAVAGATTVQPDGAGRARNAEVGELLQAPARLRTGADGSATLAFADGSLVLLRRDSELQLRQTEAATIGKAPLIALELLRGSLENQVTPIGTSGGRFEIRTPAATAAVRGTSFRLSFDAGAGVLRTEVLEGAVNVANATGQVTPKAAQGSLAAAGQTPMPPVALLTAPSLDGLPEAVERVPVDLPVGPPSGAAAYRTQIAPDAGFSVMAADETSPAARIRVPALEDGDYVVRVRAIDARGLEGLSAERALVIHAKPEAPLLIEPAPDAVVTAERPVFRWTQGDPRLAYRLQIAVAGASQAFDDQTVAGATAQPGRDLPIDRYQWRVAAIDPQKPAGKRQGPWGDAQPFRRVLPGPDVAIPPPQQGRVSLRWPAQPQTALYRLQLAQHGGFDQPLLETQTELPQYALQDLKPGAYDVRIQAIGSDGLSGPWGATQSFTVPEAPSHWRALWLLLPALLLF